MIDTSPASLPSLSPIADEFHPTEGRWQISPITPMKNHTNPHGRIR